MNIQETIDIFFLQTSQLVAVAPDVLQHQPDEQTEGDHQLQPHGGLSLEDGTCYNFMSYLYL